MCLAIGFYRLFKHCRGGKGYQKICLINITNVWPVQQWRYYERRVYHQLIHMRCSSPVKNMNVHPRTDRPWMCNTMGAKKMSSSCRRCTFSSLARQTCSSCDAIVLSSSTNVPIPKLLCLCTPKTHFALCLSSIHGATSAFSSSMVLWRQRKRRRRHVAAILRRHCGAKVQTSTFIEKLDSRHYIFSCWFFVLSWR